MQWIIAAVLYVDYAIQRSIEYSWDYAVISRAFIAAIISTAITSYSNNNFYCIVTAWLWLDFIDQIACEELTELQYFGVMAIICVYLIISDRSRTQ